MKTGLHRRLCAGLSAALLLAVGVSGCHDKAQRYDTTVEILSTRVMGAQADKAPSLIEISAARCAKVAIRGLDRKRGMVVPGLAVGLSLLLVQFTPRPVVRWVVALLGGALRRAQDQTAGRASV